VEGLAPRVLIHCVVDSVSMCVGDHVLCGDSRSRCVDVCVCACGAGMNTCIWQAITCNSAHFSPAMHIVHIMHWTINSDAHAQ